MKRYMKFLAGAACLAFLMVSLLGCSNAATTGANSVAPSNATASSATASSATASSATASSATASSATGTATTATLKTKASKDPYKDKVKIAYIPYTSASANGTAWGVGMKRLFDKYSTVDFQIFDGQGSAEKQISILSDIVTQKFDALIIQCVDSAAENAALQEVMNAGIPVISLNISPSIPHTARFSFAGYDAGYAAGLKAVEGIGGKGNVVIIGVAPEITQAVKDAPWVGFRAALDASPGIKVLEEQAGDFTTEKGNEITRDFLTKYNDISLVYGSCDAMAEGAALAIQAAGRTGIAVWGSDGETKALQYIEQGLMAGTSYCNYYDMGEHAAWFAMYAIQSDIDLNGQASIHTLCEPIVTVTKDNVKSITDRW